MGWSSKYSEKKGFWRQRVFRPLSTWFNQTSVESVKAKFQFPEDPSWWFQPLWKILVKLGIFPSKKPPPSIIDHVPREPGF